MTPSTAPDTLGPPSATASNKAPMFEAETRTILHVDIISGNDGHFSMSFSLDALLSREREMKATVEHFGVGRDRWDGSRLYNLFLEEEFPARVKNKVVLYPESYSATRSCSHPLQWTFWMVDMMQEYYQTGQLIVPDQSRGYDLLLALEYFGIIYHPDQLEFESYAVYSRVKHWSEYFTYRSEIGNYVVHKVLKQPERPVHVFGTLLVPNETLQVDNVSAVPLLSVDLDQATPQTARASAAAVYKYFNAAVGLDEEGTVDRAEAAVLMRQDFAAYVQSILTNVQASFVIQNVRCHGGDEQDRAILRLSVVSHKNKALPTKSPIRSISQLSAPMDELVHEDLKSGKLERLLRQVENRNNSSPKHEGTRDVSVGSKKKIIKPRPHRPSLLESDQVYQDLAQTTEMLMASKSFPTDSSQGGPDSSKSRDTKKRRPIIDMDSMPCGAPVNVIRAATTDQSVTSALTGPFMEDETVADMSVYEEDVRGEALKHEWIQAGLLNQGISERIEAFLETARIAAVAATTTTGESTSPTTVPIEKIKESWDWFTGLGLCECATILKKTADSEEEKITIVEKPDGKTDSDEPPVNPPIWTRMNQRENLKANRRPEGLDGETMVNDRFTLHLTAVPELDLEDASQVEVQTVDAPKDQEDSLKNVSDIAIDLSETESTTASKSRFATEDQSVSVATPSTDESRNSTEIMAPPPNPKPVKRGKKLRGGLRAFFRRRRAKKT